MRRALLTLVFCLLAAPAIAQTAPPTIQINTPFTLLFDHPGEYIHDATAAFVLYIDGVEVARLPATALVRTAMCGGVWSIGPGLEIRRGTTHVATGRGERVLCVNSNQPWVLDTGGTTWYRLVNNAWVAQGTTAPTGVNALAGTGTFAPQTITTPGLHVIEVEVVAAAGKARASLDGGLTGTVPKDLRPPFNIRFVVQVP